MLIFVIVLVRLVVLFIVVKVVVFRFRLFRNVFLVRWFCEMVSVL